MGDLELRSARPEDRDECARILYAAFRDIADRHGFPPDFASPEMAHGVMGFVLESSFGVVAERDGRVLGSNFLKEGDPVAAVGPISVDPAAQEGGVGRQLMQAVIERGRRSEALRLVQDAFNGTSMALYASLGFEVREPLVLVTGLPRSGPDPELEVRALEEDDLPACAELCRRVHGITRTEELRAARPLGARVALRDGRVTAYASSLALWFAAHGVAESARDLQALLRGGGSTPLAFLLPTRDAGLFRWALAEGLRIVKPLTLMTLGPYQEPQGPFFPSVGY